MPTASAAATRRPRRIEAIPRASSPPRVGSAPAAPWVRHQVAGGLGFEPRQAESESAVLPLDDPPSGQKALRDRPFRPARGAFQATRRGPRQPWAKAAGTMAANSSIAGTDQPYWRWFKSVTTEKKPMTPAITRPRIRVCGNEAKAADKSWS